MAGDALIGADGEPLSEDILRHLLQSSQDVLYAVDLDPVRMLYATPAFARRMGLPGDFLARGFCFDEYLSFVHPDDAERVAAIIAAIVASRTDAELPENPACYRLRRPGGGWRSIRDHYRVLRKPGGVPETLIGNARDVSGESEARQAQCRSEDRFRLLAENSRDIFFSFRLPEGRYEYVSPRVEELFGHPPEAFYDDPDLFMRCVAPHWRGTMRGWMAEVARGEVRRQYEFEVLDRQGGLRWVVERLSLSPMQEGGGMLLQGTLADITEERVARETLRASEERYRKLAEGWTGQVVIRINLRTHRYEYVSPGMERVFGYSPEEFYSGERGLVGRTVAPHWRETVQMWMAEARQGVLRPEYEYELIDAWGARRWVNQRCTLLYDALGEPEVVQGILFDITGRKALEEALAASERRYRSLHESLRDGFAAVDMQGRIIEHNSVFRDMLGYSDGEIGRLTYRDITPGKWHAMEARILEEQVLSRGYSDVYEKEYRRRDGTVFPVSLRTYVETGADAKPAALWAIVRDITAQKRAEEALLASERRFSELIRNSSDSITILDREGTQVFASHAAERMLGFTAGELMDINVIREMIHPDDQERVAEAFAAILRDGMAGAQYRHRHKNGSWVHLDAWGSNQLDNPDIRGIVVNARDVTARKLTEEALRKSEERYALALRGANDGIWDWDLAGGRVYFSDRWKEIIGYAPDELLHETGEWLSRIHPEDFDAVLDANRRCAAGQVPIFQVEYRLRHKDGSYRWILGRGASLADETGRVVRMSGAHTDITTRKEAEESLLKSERLARKLLESMQEGVWAVDADRRTIFVNERLCAMLGYSAAELAAMTLPDLLDWPQTHLAKKRFEERAAGVSGATDYVLTRKDGTRLPVHLLSSPLMEDQGRFEGLVCSIVDLTDRARMEHGLRRNQARFEALYELSRLSPATEQRMASFTLHEAIRLTDSTAGVLFFVSADGQTLTPKAWETGEFLGEGVVPAFPASGPLPWASVLHTGQPLLLNDFSQWAHLVPPGHPPMERFMGVPALDGSRPVAVLGLTGKAEPYVAEDTLQITLLLDGMWRLVRSRRDEERIRASLAEKDALLHEVHHRVKNNLQVVSSLLDMAGRRQQSAEARLCLSEMRGKVQAMSLIHAQLHSAESARGISLGRFVRALFNQLREVYAGGLDLTLRHELGDLSLGLDQAVPLGLALNEALANVFKHACPPDTDNGDGERRASRVEIRALREASGHVTIEVQDDGPGLPRELDTRRTASLGMKLMRGLVCHQLRGELEYAAADPGVRVRIRFLPHAVK